MSSGFSFGGINVASKKAVLNIKTIDEIVLLDHSEKRSDYPFPVVVLADQIYSPRKLSMITAFLNSAGLSSFKIVSALNCIPRADIVKKEGLINFYSTNRSDFKSEIPDGAVIVTLGPALYSLTRSDDVYPIYCKNFLSSKLSIFFEGHHVFPLESMDSVFADGYTQGPVDSFVTKIMLFQLKHLVSSHKNFQPRIPKINLVDVTTPKMAQELLQSWGYVEDQLICVDLETSSLDFMLGEIGCVTITLDGVTGYFFPWKFFEDSPHLKKILNDFLGRNRCLGANLKFDLKFLWRFGVPDIRVAEDIVQMGHTLDEQRSNSLKTLAYFYTPWGGYDYDLEAYLKKTGIDNYLEIPHDILFPYATMDVIVTWHVYHSMLNHMRELDRSVFKENPKKTHHTLESFYSEKRMPSSNLYAKMEFKGVYIDVDKLSENRSKVIGYIEDLKVKMGEAMKVPPHFDWGSPKKLGLLLEELGWEDLGRNASGEYQCSDFQLERWARYHDGAKLIQDYRTAKVILNTFLGDKKGSKGWTQYLRYHEEDDSWRMHAQFNVMGTETGRSRCSNPNLQNVPTAVAFSKEVKECVSVPDKEDYYLVTLDYSALQMRLAAADSMDPALCKAFMNKETSDVHSLTGYGVFVTGKKWDIEIVEVEDDHGKYKFLGGQIIETENRGEIFAKDLKEDDVLVH